MCTNGHKNTENASPRSGPQTRTISLSAYNVTVFSILQYNEKYILRNVCCVIITSFMSFVSQGPRGLLGPRGPPGPPGQPVSISVTQFCCTLFSGLSANLMWWLSTGCRRCGRSSGSQRKHGTILDTLIFSSTSCSRLLNFICHERNVFPPWRFTG